MLSSTQGSQNQQDLEHLAYWVNVLVGLLTASSKLTDCHNCDESKDFGKSRNYYDNGRSVHELMLSDEWNTAQPRRLKKHDISCYATAHGCHKLALGEQRSGDFSS